MKQKVLVLGGGQLARMLSEAGQKLDLDVHVYAQTQGQSASFVTKEVTVGELSDEKILKPLLSQFSLATVENEFIAVPTFKKLTQGTSTIFVPALDTLAFTQDKLEQKKLFEGLKIPTTEYNLYQGPPKDLAALKSWLATILNTWGSVILKWSRHGYDGKGNLAVDKKLPFENVVAFYEEGIGKGAQIFGERKVEFEREVAIQIAHSTKTQGLVFYPLVVTEQVRGICIRVLGPATAFGISAKVEASIQSVGASIARSIPIEGLFALEGFVTHKGQFLVNEIAPRVHNSGHYTVHVSNCSQFENHLRAVSGKPLVKPQISAPYFAMLNILGPVGGSDAATKEAIEKKFISAIPGLRNMVANRSADDQSGRGEVFYWYDKTTRPLRKLGHITLWSKSLSDLENRLKIWQERIKG